MSGVTRRTKARWQTAALTAVMFLVLGALLVVRPSLVLAPVGRFLVVADPLVPADAVVSLAGERLGERAFATRDVYRAGWAGRVILSQEPRPWLADRIEHLGIPVWLGHDLSHRVLTGSGVPDAAIELLPPTENTLGEALAVRRLVQTRGWSSVIVVTSKFHARRACWTFRRILRGTARVICHPSPYDRFDPERWWQDDRMALSLASEYLKLAANALADLFGPRPA